MTHSFRAQAFCTGSLLLLAILIAACGDPRASGMPPFGAPTPAIAKLLDSLSRDSTARADSVSSGENAAPAFEERTWTGAYRRPEGRSEFFPCRDTAAYRMRGRGDAMGVLRDRYRWHAVDPVRALYAVFRGAFVTDTLRGPADSAGAEPRVVQTFVLTGVDTLRTWRRGDCGMDQPPSW
ncbi:MAG TPA: hypothetical protein VF178_09665 [Gemmatimonadaceae bacterium]